MKQHKVGRQPRFPGSADPSMIPAWPLYGSLSQVSKVPEWIFFFQCVSGGGLTDSSPNPTEVP